MALHTKDLGDKSVMIRGGGRYLIVKLIEAENTIAVARAWEAGEVEKYDSISEIFLLNYTNKFQTSSVQHCVCS